MADPEAVAHVRAYLEQHRATYTRDALRKQLLADGHDPQAVDQALAEVYFAPENAPPNPIQRKSNILVILLVVVGTVLLNASLCVVTINTNWLFLLAGLVLEVIAIVYFWRSRPSAARGILWGILASVLLVVAAIAFVVFLLSAEGFS